MTITPITAPEIERDRWGRPLVHPPQGAAGKPVAYTRCTTFVGCVEDTYNLSKWQQRMVALGLADRPDLLLAVSAHRDDKKALGTICAEAQDAAKAHAAATTGTALHSLTEQMDRGQELGVVPEAYIADLAAYREATADLEAVHIEEFTVQDMLKVGGTPDRIVRYRGQRYIADLKTGEIKYGHLKIAAQLAMYARSSLYNPRTYERTPHGADLKRGIVVHLPAGTGTCRLYWIDLEQGWEVVKLAKRIRDMRALSFSQLITGIGTGEDPAAEVDTPLPLESPQDPPHTPTLIDAIAAAPSREEVEKLWRDFAREWTPQHTELAKARIAALASSPTH